MQHYSASAWLYLKYVKIHKHWIKKLDIKGKVENVISYFTLLTVCPVGFRPCQIAITTTNEWA